MKTSRFDNVLKAMDKFESGMAEGTLTGKKGIKALLSEMMQEATVLTNEGSLPPGTSSTMLKLRRLAKDALAAIENGTLATLGDLRRFSRDSVGPTHTMLKKQLSGTETAEDKAQMRGFESDSDKSKEINRLVEAFDPGSTLVKGEQIKGWKTMVGQFLDLHFSKSQLHSIRPFKSEETTAGGEPKRDPECFWNHLTLGDIVDASSGTQKGKAHLSEIKRKLVQRHDDDLATLTHSYKDLNRKLPHAIRAPFQAIYFPVVPVFEDISVYKNPSRLTNAGIRVTPIGDHFIVLENQLLLCVDLDKIGVKASLRDTGERMKTVNNSHDLEDKISSIIESINEAAVHNGQRFALASDRVVRNPKNPRIALVWLIDERARKKLANVLNSIRVQWSIPFTGNEDK